MFRSELLDDAVGDVRCWGRSVRWTRARPPGPGPGARQRHVPTGQRTYVRLPSLLMQLRLDAADRLVELVEERRGPVFAEEAARRLFALRTAPVALARSLLAGGVEGDG